MFAINLLDMKSFLICTILLSNLLFFNPVFAQTAAEPDLASAKAMLAENKYENARALLESQLTLFPDNFYLYWMHANATHQLGEPLVSYNSYEMAITLSKENQEVIMDYGRVLFNDGKFVKAVAQFDNILTHKKNESTYYEALVMKGYALYYMGDMKKSKQIMQSVLAEDSSLDYIKSFISDLEYVMAPYVNLGITHASDDQPLDIWESTLEAGFVSSRFFNPSLKVINYNFEMESPSHSLKVMVGNKFNFAKYGFSVNATAGMYQHFSSKESAWVGAINIDKKLLKDFSGFLQWERTPYLGTKYSGENMLMQDQFGGGLTYDSPRLFNMSVRYTNSQYENKNGVQSLGAWIVSRPFVAGISKWSFGYGISYANAKEVGFVPAADLESLSAQYPVGSQLPGVYTPYYTPSDEVVHSIIADVQLKLPVGFNFSTKATYGFRAENNVPLLFSQLDDNGTYGYKTTTYRAEYNPYTVKVGLDRQFSRKLGMNVFYKRQNAFYYSQDMLGFNLSFKFL